MSQKSNQSRNESGQHMKIGQCDGYNRSGQFLNNKGMWGPSSTPSNAPNLSSNGKYNGNAQGQLMPNGGSQQQQQPSRVHDVPATATTPGNVRPTVGRYKSFVATANKAASSNVPATTQPSNVPSSSEPIAPAKALENVAAGSFSLQFGSLGPGLTNGVQIPARTSSAPPNLNDQKKAEVRPFIHKQPLPKKDLVDLDQTNTQDSSKSTRESQVARVQTLKSVVQHPAPGIHIQLPYQVPLQSSPTSPQIQSHVMPPMSFQPLPLMPYAPMPLMMPLFMGNPLMQPSMYFPGLPLHSLHPQVGHGLFFAMPMGPQIAPQFSNVVAGNGPQFSLHQAGIYSPSRKPVKITHPETHEEIRLLDLSAGEMSHPNVTPPLQQSVDSFSSPVTLNSTHIPPTSQPPVSNSQVTVRAPVNEKTLPPNTSSLAGKIKFENPSVLHVQDQFHPQETETPSLSILHKSKPDIEPTFKHDAPSERVVVKIDVNTTSDLTSVPIASSASKLMDSTCESRNGVVTLDSIKDKVEGESSSKSLHSQGVEASLEYLQISTKSEESTGNEVAPATTSDIGKTSQVLEEPSMKAPGFLVQNDNSAPVLVPSRLVGARDIVDNSSVKDEVLSDTYEAKAAEPRGKMGKKDIYKKAEAAAFSSDLHNANKGLEEKEDVIDENTSINLKSTVIDVSRDNTVSISKHAQSKVEQDDWENTDETPTPELEISNNGGGKDGNRRYSRDFLLQFAEQCNNLPDGFEITSDISGVLVVTDVNISRDSTNPSHGRSDERPISRLDRRGSGFSEEYKRNKFQYTPMSSRGDMRHDSRHTTNAGLWHGQGSSYRVHGNPRSPTPPQYAGGILTRPMLSHGPDMQRNNYNCDRWQRGGNIHKGLLPTPQGPMIHRAGKKYEVSKVTDEEQAKQRQLKGILNKLTPQNFEKLFQQVKKVNIDNVVTLSGVISQIFDKALMEPTFCEMYADFCFHLAAELPDLSIDNKKITFKVLLLNKCQEEFERGEREEDEANKAEGESTLTTQEREEKRLQTRRRMLGNIRLIGELYKRKMLTERIMHSCIKKLLGQIANPDEENIEALCKLMSTIGEMIDHSLAKEHMDYYFNVMLQLSDNVKLASRVRFMLKDAIDLRKNNWQQRRKVEGPKMIGEVHKDAAQERHAQSTRLAHGSFGMLARRVPPVDFSPRSPDMLPPSTSHMGGFRPVSMRSYNNSQDTRTKGRPSFESRVMPVPLTHRPAIDGSITLRPQGGLARGMARGHPSPNISPRPGPNRFSSRPERVAYSQREDIGTRYGPGLFAAPPLYEHSHQHYGSRATKSTDHVFERSMLSSPPGQGAPQITVQHDSSSENVLSEEHLQDKSMTAIKEYYSARDEKEVALRIKDMNSPSYYPSMVSIWVIDSFERKGVDRDALTKLLINLTKPGDAMLISEDQLIKGFETVLKVLEDAENDAPRASEFLGRIFAKFILEKIISLSEIGRIIYEGGEEPGQLVEAGLAAKVLGTILEIIKTEKGDSVLNEIRSSSKLQLEKFRPPGSDKQFVIDKFI